MLQSGRFASSEGAIVGSFCFCLAMCHAPECIIESTKVYATGFRRHLHLVLSAWKIIAVQNFESLLQSLS